MEAKYSTLSATEKEKMKGWDNDLLEGRNLERALAGFERIDNFKLKLGSGLILSLLATIKPIKGLQ